MGERERERNAQKYHQQHAQEIGVRMERESDAG